MVHVDVPKVRGKMAEKGYTITSLSKELEIARPTLSNYLDEPQKMPYLIIDAMARILCDSADEAREIFFAPDLRSA
jgi:predicted transcriptional regulator